MGFLVWVDNINNFFVCVEYWFGDGIGIDDFIIVLIDFGFGVVCYCYG